MNNTPLLIAVILLGCAVLSGPALQALDMVLTFAAWLVQSGALRTFGA